MNCYRCARERGEDESLIRRVRGWRRKVERRTRIIGLDTLVFAGDGGRGRRGSIGEIEASSIRYRVSVAPTERVPPYNHFFSLFFLAPTLPPSAGHLVSFFDRRGTREHHKFPRVPTRAEKSTWLNVKNKQARSVSVSIAELSVCAVGIRYRYLRILPNSFLVSYISESCLGCTLFVTPISKKRNVFRKFEYGRNIYMKNYATMIRIICNKSTSVRITLCMNYRSLGYLGYPRDGQDIRHDVDYIIIDW